MKLSKEQSEWLILKLINDLRAYHDFKFWSKQDVLLLIEECSKEEEK